MIILRKFCSFSTLSTTCISINSDNHTKCKVHVYVSSNYHYPKLCLSLTRLIYFPFLNKHTISHKKLDVTSQITNLGH